VTPIRAFNKSHSWIRKREKYKSGDWGTTKYGDLRVFAGHNAGKIGDIGSQGMNVPVSFDKNLHVELHQTFEAHESLSAVHVGIGSCKVTPHESIPCSRTFARTYIRSRMAGLSKNETCMTPVCAGVQGSDFRADF
jgi:hypothetical protein